MAGIGEYLIAVGLALVAGFAASSKVWHEFNGLIKWLLLFIVLLLCCAFAASFVEQGMEHEMSHIPGLWSKLVKKRRSTRWEATIDFVVADAMPALYQRRGTAVLVGAEVINHGEPSVLGRWRLTVQIPNSQPFTLEPEVLPSQITLAPSSGKKYVVYSSNSLYAKVSQNPIPTGGREDGVLWFLATNVDLVEMRRPGTKYTLSFIDADAKPGETEYVVPAAASSDYPYIPGEMTESTQPAPPLESSPTVKPEIRIPKTKTAPDKAPIQISAVFLDPQAPTIVVSNSSDVVAEGVTWTLNAIRTSDAEFLGFVSQSLGYIKAHSETARCSLELNRLPHSSEGNATIKDGDELTGSISIDCPHCQLRTYIVHFVWLKSGWYFEYPGKSAGAILPRDMSKEGRERYIQWLTGPAFADKRIEVVSKPQ